MQVEDVLQLLLSEVDMCVFWLGSVLNCCIEGDFFKAEMSCLHELCKASNAVWK